MARQGNPSGRRRAVGRAYRRSLLAARYASHARARRRTDRERNTSGAAHGVAGFVGPYGAAKHALDALTAAVDLEAAPFGIRAVTVVPGTYPTGMTTKIVMAPIVEPYGDGHIRLMEKLQEAFGDRNDLSVVVDAIVSAVTDPEPACIALAGLELAGRIGLIVDAKLAFHRMLGGLS